MHTLKIIKLLHIRKMGKLNLQFISVSMIIVERKTQVLKTFTMCGNSKLLRLMNREKYVYIDTTFYYALKGYKKILIAIIYNEDMEMHFDLLHIIMTSK